MTRTIVTKSDVAEELLESGCRDRGSLHDCNSIF